MNIQDWTLRYVTVQIQESFKNNKKISPVVQNMSTKKGCYLNSINFQLKMYLKNYRKIRNQLFCLWIINWIYYIFAWLKLETFLSALIKVK